MRRPEHADIKGAIAELADIECSLRQMRSRGEALLEGRTSPPVFELRLTGDATITVADEKLAKRLGYDCLVGMELADIVHPHDVTIAYRQHLTAVARGQAGNLLVRLVGASAQASWYETIFSTSGLYMAVSPVPVPHTAAGDPRGP